MTRDLIRLTHILFLPAAEGSRMGAWCPAADVYQGASGWLVKFELAGVRAEDIDLEALGTRLTVRGTRRDCFREEGCSYYLMEIAYGRFERSLELPFNLDRADITTEYRDGLLLVHIQLAEGPR